MLRGAWALERVGRMERRLQRGRPTSERLVAEIPWLEVVTAFTATGRYICFSRGFHERCYNDEQVALVIGHVEPLGRWVSVFEGKLLLPRSLQRENGPGVSLPLTAF